MTFGNAFGKKCHLVKNKLPNDFAHFPKYQKFYQIPGGIWEKFLHLGGFRSQCNATFPYGLDSTSTT